MSARGADNYRASMKSHPLLSREEERELAERARDGCAKSRAKLIKSNLRFVAKIANEHSGYGLPIEDLIQEGNAGLVIAVDRFDQSKGNRFLTFAWHWVRESIRRHILRHYQPVAISFSDKPRFLFFALRPTRMRLGDDATREDIAEALNVDEADIARMDALVGARGVSYEHKPDGGRAMADMLSDSSPSPFDIVADADERRHDEARVASAASFFSA